MKQAQVDIKFDYQLGSSDHKLKLDSDYRELVCIRLKRAFSKKLR